MLMLLQDETIYRLLYTLITGVDMEILAFWFQPEEGNVGDQLSIEAEQIAVPLIEATVHDGSTYRDDSEGPVCVEAIFPKIDWSTNRIFFVNFQHYQCLQVFAMM
jgi:hypothetical protein